MFRLKKHHLGAFASAWQEEFLRRVRPYLRATFPERTGPLADGDLDEHLRAALAQAERYGLRTEFAAACVAHLRFLLGGEFENDADWEWVAALLRDGRYDENERAEWAVRFAENWLAPLETSA
jgi:hypothetical protein